MINEKTFVKKYTSFWKNLFPLSNLFMRSVHLETAECKEELDIDTTGRRMSFVSHLGFLLFSLVVKRELTLREVKNLKIKSDAYKNLEMLAIEQFKVYEDDDPKINTPLNATEFDDAISLAERLCKRFIDLDKVIISPPFKGCGYIDDCNGDVIYGFTLFEIKTVNRNFHIQDFRQLMTYFALNYSSKQHNISSIGIYNPRNAMEYIIPINDFSRAISGRDFPELCWETLNFISTDETSK